MVAQFWVQGVKMTSCHFHCRSVHVLSFIPSGEAGTGEPPLEGSFVYQSVEIRRQQVGLEGQAGQWRVGMSMPRR